MKAASAALQQRADVLTDTITLTLTLTLT